MVCQDCGGSPDGGLLLVWADMGRGAFAAVLCDVCWHRRKYRRELELRRDERRGSEIREHVAE